MTLRPDRFCNLIYAWAIERVEDVTEFNRVLFEPVAGKSVSSAVLDDEGAGFMSFMSQVTG